MRPRIWDSSARSLLTCLGTSGVSALNVVLANGHGIRPIRNVFPVPLAEAITAAAFH